MPKKKGTTKNASDIAAFLGIGGKKVPAGVAAKAAAVTKSMLLKELVGSNPRVHGAKLYGELKGGSPIAVDDPANRKTLDAILRMHRKAASKKLPFPKVISPFGGFPPGSISFSGTKVPPFDFASPNPESGNPPVFSTANKNGQMTANVATSELGPNSDYALAGVGIYFTPPVAGTLTISTTLTYSFEELTNSLNTAPVEALASILLYISATNGHEIKNTKQLYSYSLTGQVQFDFQSDVPLPLSASLEVTPPFTYGCSVWLLAGASGQGWPGSLALSSVSVVVPSFRYAFFGRSGPPGPWPVK